MFIDYGNRQNIGAFYGCKWVEVWRLTRPPPELNMLFLEPLLCSPGSMF